MEAGSNHLWFTHREFTKNTNKFQTEFCQLKI